MDINGIKTQSISSIYALNEAKRVDNTEEVIDKDKIEISDLGKMLSLYDNLDLNIDNTAKVAELRVQIENGTYNVDARLTAQSIVNCIKEGRRINDK